MVEDLNSELPRTNPASGSGTATIYSQGRKEGVMDERTTDVPSLQYILVHVIASFVVIFGVNTTSDISKLSYEISRAVRRVKFETILKYHEWYLCQISRTNHAIICLMYNTIRKKFVIFTCRYFTAPSQSNCRNFSCSSINM